MVEEWLDTIYEKLESIIVIESFNLSNRRYTIEAKDNEFIELLELKPYFGINYYNSIIEILFFKNGAKISFLGSDYIIVDNLDDLLKEINWLHINNIKEKHR